MKFINPKQTTIKVRLKDSTETSGYKWVSVPPGRIVELKIAHPIALIKGLLPVEENKEKVETEKKPSEKVEEKPEFDIELVNKKYLDKLLKIKGVGQETAKDITKLYPTEKDLKKALKKKIEMPFRNDVCKALKKKFK